MDNSFSPIKVPSLTAIVHKIVLHPPNNLPAREVLQLMGYNHYNTGMAELTNPERKFDADRVLPAMLATDSDAPMHFLARELGGVFVRIPKATPETCEMVKQLSAVIKECSDFFSETAQDISDGKIPADQLARIQREGHEALTAITAMMQLAAKVHEQQYGSPK